MKKFKWIFTEFKDCFKEAKWYQLPFIIFGGMIFIPMLCFVQLIADDEEDNKRAEEFFDMLLEDYDFDS